MSGIFEEYLKIGMLEFIYAFVLTLFILLSVYFYKRSRENADAITRLKRSLQEAELDRVSLMANSTVEPEAAECEQEILKTEANSHNTMLQQELEEYLLREEEKAETAEQNCVELSADFIDFLKVKSGKIKLKETAFTLNDMLDDLAKSLRSQMARTKVELIFDIDTRIPPKLIGDKRHLRLLLFNVLSNIIHHRSETQIILHARSIKEEKNLRLLFNIQGCILEESVGNTDSIFVPFSDSAFDESMQIEFYIARELARMMRGDMGLSKDQLGKNEFSIEVLLAESNPDDNRFYRLPSRSMIGHKILIVNENKRLAKSIQNMYEYFKNEVTLLLSSEFLLKPEIISEFHTVVIDKDLLGLSLVEKLRAIKRSHQVNIVALLHAKDDVGYQLPLGAVDQLLIKPITIQSVFNTIVALEESKEAAAENNTLVPSPEDESNRKTFEDFYSRRILVIENERVNQKMILSLLRRSGINLTLAQSAKESLWMFQKMRVFDIILIGVEIDRETTLRLSQKIRSLSRYKGVPIVIMSKDKRDDDSAGIDQYISKPVQAAELYSLFNHYLSKESTLAEDNVQFMPKAAFINTVSLAARDGFEMASFDEELYIEILKEFIALYSDSAKKMNSILVQDELEDLKQICLDVKGVAANIGAFRLSSITAQIHASISKGKVKDLMALMNQYQPELERVKKEIQAYLKK